jgi:uncharacterized membrane protein
MKIDPKLKLILIISSAIGAVDSLYLTWIKLSHNEKICLPGIGNCETVNTSRYAEVFGIPTALLGLLAYLIILAFLLVENRQVLNLQVKKEISIMAVFGLALFGLLYSVYLTYIEIAVIHAICPFCVVSAVAMLTIFIFSLTRLVKNQE